MLTDNGPIEKFEQECAHEIVKQMRIDAQVPSSVTFQSSGAASSGTAQHTNLDPCEDLQAYVAGLTVASGPGTNPVEYSDQSVRVSQVEEAADVTASCAFAEQLDSNSADVDVACHCADPVAASNLGVDTNEASGQDANSVSVDDCIAGQGMDLMDGCIAASAQDELKGDGAIINDARTNAPQPQPGNKCKKKSGELLGQQQLKFIKQKK